MPRPLVALLLLYFLADSASALEPEAGAVFCRVVDVGAGLCCVVVMPGDHYMIYDAGNYRDRGTTAFTAIEELITPGSEIDLLVLSHSDADHLGATDLIIDAYQVQKVIRSGFSRTTNTWKNADEAINNAEADGSLEDLVLKELDEQELPFGAAFEFGNTRVTFVAGWHEPPDDFGNLSTSEFRNAGSIVMRLEFAGKSILFCGDTVGRHTGDAEDVCIAAEKFMVDNQSGVPIDSDVLIAAHHGADNGTSAAFIEAVTPRFVVFSAGHYHEHPRNSTAHRLLSRGMNAANILRTDRADDEDGSQEWKHLSVPHHRDPLGDDDVDILIRPDGTLLADYRAPDPMLSLIALSQGESLHEAATPSPAAGELWRLGTMKTAERDPALVVMKQELAELRARIEEVARRSQLRAVQDESTEIRVAVEDGLREIREHLDDRPETIVVRTESTGSAFNPWYAAALAVLLVLQLVFLFFPATRTDPVLLKLNDTVNELARKVSDQSRS